MFNWNLIKDVLVGKQPPIPVARADYEHLYPEGLTMGTLYIGRQGTGKTSSLARHLVDYFKAYPNRAIFVLDWSGAISDSILNMILQEPSQDQLVKRLVYDEIGNREWTIPMPEFSPYYGPLINGFDGERMMYEDQVQRVATNLVKLAPELVQGAPYLAGLGLREIAPQIMRLLTAISNEHGECWQITEAKRLVVDKFQTMLAVRNYGDKIPESKFFFERMFLPLKDQERELRTFAILALLGAIEPREIRARVGYYRPGWTPHEAIAKGLMVLVNGANLISQKNAQHYLFTQVYSLIMSEINRRQPNDPKDQPVALVMDEVYSLLGIPGMADEVAMLSPLYRSRKLELYVVLQSLGQLAPTLRQQIWSIGNVVSFAIENKDEAEEIGRQLFSYNPTLAKLPAQKEGQNPVSEPEHGQDRQVADWIQSLKFRECVMKRYVSEKQRDPKIRHVLKTKDMPARPQSGTIYELKEKLLKERGVLIRDSLEVINQRKLVAFNQKKPPQV